VVVSNTASKDRARRSADVGEKSMIVSSATSEYKCSGKLDKGSIPTMQRMIGIWLWWTRHWLDTGFIAEPYTCVKSP
jgi:hypothetical protein